MANLPWMPLDVDRTLSDPDLLLLTPAQFGAYVRIRMFLWRADKCELPADDETLARLTGLDENELGPVAKLFTIRDGKLRDSELKREKKRRQKVSDSNAKKASKAAQAKHNKRVTESASSMPDAVLQAGELDKDKDKKDKGEIDQGSGSRFRTSVSEKEARNGQAVHALTPADLPKYIAEYIDRGGNVGVWVKRVRELQDKPGGIDYLREKIAYIAAAQGPKAASKGLTRLDNPASYLNSATRKFLDGEPDHKPVAVTPIPAPKPDNVRSFEEMRAAQGDVSNVIAELAKAKQAAKGTA